MARILIVEDDALVSRMYQQAFEFDGYEVALAGDGEEGLRKLKEKSPTLILLDLMMPKMNGLEVLDAIEADPATKKIPVIVLTNLADSDSAEKALGKGAIKYIVKSKYKPKEVVAIVKEILAAYTREELPKARKQ